MLLPKPPRKGEKVLEWARQITEFIKENTPRSGSGVGVCRTPGGTSFFGKKNFWKFPIHFEVLPDYDYSPTGTELRVKIRGGTWTVQGGNGAAQDLNVSDVGADSHTDSVDGSLFSYATPKAGHTVDDGETQWWCLVLYEETALVPASLVLQEIKQATLPTYSDLGVPPGSFKVLASVLNDGGVFDIQQEWTGGSPNTFFLVPDSIGQSPTGQYVKSLGYVDVSVSNATARYMAEDYNAHEILIETSDVVSENGDLAIPYFTYSTTGATVKNYTRVDSSNFLSHGGGESIEIATVGDTSGIQLLDFSDGAAESLTDATLELDGSSGHWTVLLRKNTTDGYVLQYGDFSTMKVADSYTADDAIHADDADNADHADAADYADEAGYVEMLHHELKDTADGTWADNEDHDLRYWPRAGVGSTLDYATTGYCVAGSFSPGAGNGWDTTNFNIDVTNIDMTGTNTSLSFGTLDFDCSSMDFDSSSGTDMEAGTSFDITSGTTMLLTSGTTFEINAGSTGLIGTTTDLTLSCGNDLEAYSAANMLFDSSGTGDFISVGDLTLQSSGADVDIISGNDINLLSGADITVDSDAFDLTFTSMTVNSQGMVDRTSNLNMVADDGTLVPVKVYGGFTQIQ